MSSIPSTTDILIDVTRKYTLAVYPLLIVTGLIGNIANVMIFNFVKAFRRNQCARYFTVAAIADFFFILIVGPFRVTEYVINYDPIHLSVVWCKIRQSIVPAFSLMSFSAVCFAAIDQYLATNYHPYLRRYSTLKLAHRLIIGATIVWILYMIPSLMYFDVQNSAGCVITNAGYSRFYSFVHFCVLSGVLPILVSGSSAALAFFNVRHVIRHQVPLVRRRLDRQLTAMTLTKVVFLVILTTPFVIFRIYILNVSVGQDEVRRAVFNKLIPSITSSLFLLNSADTFYVFLMVSSRFRHQVQHAMSKAFWRKLFSAGHQHSHHSNRTHSQHHHHHQPSEQQQAQQQQHHYHNQVAPGSDPAETELD